MVISVSRRTDIPCYYSDWFFNRLHEGYAITRNPMNHNQTKRVSLSRPDVDCFVFWTKNPAPMLYHLGELTGFQYYFQFTVTSYAADIEINLPNKSDIIDTFMRLSDDIGQERVIWRYDPVLLTEKYSLEYHIQYFGEIARRLNEYTNVVIFSYIDLYSKFLKRFSIHEMSLDEKILIARNFSKIAEENHMLIKTCSEEIELSNYGITHASCIDGNLIERLTGNSYNKRDKNQRTACGCIPSVDIGIYNTCQNGCLYCYANYSSAAIQTNVNRHNQHSPMMLD